MPLLGVDLSEDTLSPSLPRKVIRCRHCSSSASKPDCQKVGALFNVHFVYLEYMIHVYMICNQIQK